MPTKTCDRCGHPLPDGARFCPNCGAPVAAAVTEERRVVTVLFADLVRSTELAARLDPERFRELMAAFYRMVSMELESLRGRAEKFVGDAVMAVFGVPIAHEDDALRAVRAGVVIRDRTARLGEELGLPVPLQVRVGINSGPVATGSGPAGQLLVSGAAVNTAARLQEAAEPGEVLAGQTTAQLTRYAVAFGPTRRIAARGFEGALLARSVEGLSTRSVRRTIPLVGRRRELALLQDAFERASEAARPHLVTVLGETGIGKSRLAEEFVAGLPEGARALTGRASMFEEDATFAPLADLIRRELGVERDADPKEVGERLGELVDGCCDPSETEQVAARLGLALGLAEPVAAGEGRSYRAAEIRAGFAGLLRGLARSGPLLLLFEDLHLARPGLLDLIEHVAAEARGIPLLLLCLARDDLLEARPDWGAGVADSLRIRLAPLRFDDAKELALRAGEEPIGEATAERVAGRTGGNPFFIVETTGMLLQEHPEHVAGIPHNHLLPPTVQAVVASRLDHLREDARALVRRASVFPRATFDLAELSIIAEPTPERLALLRDAEILVPVPDRQGVWRFRHGILRDVAYQSLAKRERLRLHVAVADALESEEGRHPHSVAYHLEQAAHASLDLDPKDRDLADRALTALADAGDRARRSMESATAADFYRRALGLGAEEDRGPREARVLAGLGEAHYWLGEYEEAAEALSAALSAGSGDDWTQTHASRFLADIALNIRGDQDGAEALFDRALDAARRLGDPWAMARTLLMGGWAPFWREDLGAARAMFEEALGITRENPAGDRWAEARALTSLASVISPAGDERECLALAEEALAIGRELGDRFTVAVAQSYVGSSLRRMWRLEEAGPPEDEAVATFRELGARWELASALGDRGSAHRLSGRLVEAEADLREALRICREIGDRSLLGWTAGELARVLLARGDHAGARAALDQPAFGVSEDRVAMLAAESLVELLAGDPDRARALALELLELERRDGSPNHRAARTWWVARLFGDDAVGGAEAAGEARRVLEAASWIQAVREPDLWSRVDSGPAGPGAAREP